MATTAIEHKHGDHKFVIVNEDCETTVQFGYREAKIVLNEHTGSEPFRIYYPGGTSRPMPDMRSAIGEACNALVEIAKRPDHKESCAEMESYIMNLS